MRRARLLLAVRIAAWVLVAACVVVFARKLDWHQVYGAFQGVDLRLAALAAAVVIPCVALQGLRWSAVVNAVRRVPRFTPVAANYVGQAASVFLPMRAGEAVRAGLLARATGIGRATALGTVALDHSVNGLVMFAFAAVLPALLPVPRWVAVTAWVGMAGAIALVLSLLWLAKHPESHVASGSGRIAYAVARARSGLIAARNPRAVAEAALFSALAWSVEIGITMLALAAFNLPHDLPHAMGVLFGLNIALAIPSPPASLGSFELGAGTALVAFGGDPGHAAAFAIGLHAIQLLPALVMGGLMLSVFRRPPPAPVLPPAGAQEA
jgi:glycosyltransferase 2 family protein